jgi:hypothetical protein
MIMTLMVFVIPMVMPVIVLGGMLTFVSVFLILSLALASQREENCHND